MQGIIPALLLIIIEETTEYFGFDTYPAGKVQQREEFEKGIASSPGTERIST